MFIYKYGKIEAVKLIIAPGTLKLESEKADYGEIVDEIEIEYEGESFQMDLIPGTC
ncbi:MAG: hypothetical protein Ct9H300mP28_17110 [Pseudomonadota bacterium]|nr:MAG: hypothetical protein Ct9H300mP28_17110 [Pseudomonadota bacterium]